MAAPRLDLLSQDLRARVESCDLKALGDDSDHQADLGSSVLQTVLVLGGGLTSPEAPLGAPLNPKFQ